ncbi:RCC1 domain-containing protein [Archangium violaceum]|uniref:RCC1 domain-containing protein n=1 Tax=Archangium violaceum TaxID=83451 RepID=UPI001EF10D6C|nr:hypothetical protein [Archangium violaceum]
MLGSALVVGCGGQEGNTEQSPSAVGQVERGLSRSVPMQVTALSGVEKVFAGTSNVFAITGDTKRWGWGFNAYGQLGDGTTTSRSVPAEMPSGLSTAVDFDGGDWHSIVLLGDGSVHTFGFNILGQLGHGASGGNPVVTGAKAVAAGINHSVALTNDGRVLTWGHNYSGALGDGTTTTHYSPVHVTGFGGVPITAIAANGDNTYALDSNGNVWGWGVNINRQLGIISEPLKVPRKIPELSPAKAIAAGESFVVALKTDGTVWSTGGFIPTWQVAGLPTSSPITSIAAGDTVALAVAQDGSLWSWSSTNGYGELGNCTTSSTVNNGPNTAVRVASSCTPSGTPAAYLSGVVSASGTHNSAFAVLEDGTLWSWGRDDNGVLGTNE